VRNVVDRCIRTLSLLLALTGCAAPDGPVLTEAATPASARYGHLYIYRPDVWFTAAVAVPVTIGTVREASLPNAGYLRIRLSPGFHVVNVNGVTARVGIVGGMNRYLELDLTRSTSGMAALSSNTLATTLTQRGELHLRDESLALPALRGLKRAGDLTE
jgi:hypothetical protein